MKLVKHDQYIRIDISEYESAKDVISNIKRHVDGIEWAGEQWDSATYIVNGVEYHHKAEAILAAIMFEENFEDECNVIYDSHVNNLGLTCSRIENDHSKDGYTDRTAHGEETTYGIVEILTRQPYLHRFSDNMSQELADAFTKLSEEIIKAKKEDSSIFTAQ
jgi:hypothetical protein